LLRSLAHELILHSSDHINQTECSATHLIHIQPIRRVVITAQIERLTLENFHAKKFT